MPEKEVENLWKVVVCKLRYHPVKVVPLQKIHCRIDKKWTEYLWQNRNGLGQNDLIISQISAKILLMK